MLRDLLWLSASLSLAAAPVAAQAPVLPKPTLEFNVSLALGTLNIASPQYRRWATQYANTANAAKGTVGQGPAQLVATDRRPDLPVTAAMKSVYVFGDLGPAGTLGDPEIKFLHDTYLDNSVRGATSGLIGKLTGLEWFKYAGDGYKPLWIYADADKPTISEIIVTTGIESNA